jgi:hypothetical protein
VILVSIFAHKLFSRNILTYTLVVDDLDDSSEFAGICAIFEEDDTADFNESPLG